MKNKKTKPANSASRIPRRPVMIVTAIALLAIAAITVVSRQSAHSNQINNPQSAAKAPEYVKTKVAAQDPQLNAQQIRPLTQEEAEQLAQRLKGMLNKSTDGLVEVKQKDGSSSIDLQGRFQNVTVARVNADGTISQSCVDNPQAAASFFRIDPKLLEEDKPLRPTPIN